MCRAAVAAAAAAVGKPGAAAAASALPRPGGLPMLHSLSTQQGGVARQHMPLAPSPFDSQLLAQSLRNEPDFMRSLGVAGGPRGSSHGADTSLSGGTAAERTFSGGMHRGVGRTLSQDSDGLVPSLDELAAMEDLPDDLQQARQ